MSSPPSERTPWYSSIVARITLVFATLLLITMVITGWIAYKASRDELIAQAHADMRHTLNVAATRTNAFAHALSEDIDLLATNDAINTFCAQADTTDTIALSAALAHSAGLMEPFIRSHALYAQVRLIDADSLGHELVRFDREGERIVRMPDSLLQPKGTRDYYKTTMALGRTERYFSPIDLNKEHGVVVRPLLPTLRASAPLFSPRGTRAGIVIINTDLRPFFAELSSLADSGQALMLADARGELLLHPDTAHMFRSEFGGSYTLDDALPLLRNTLPNDPLLAEVRTITIGPGNTRYTLAISQPMSAVLRDLRAKRDAIAKVLALLAGGAVLLSMLFALGLRGRLNRLTRRMERYAIGEKEELPVGRSDEIGRMARGLRQMQQRIDARVQELEAARASAEASDRQRRELLANMSHEVRTPLNAIMGMTSDLDTARMTESDREKIAIVQRSAARLKGLVDDLLTHARIGEGKLVVNISAVDVRTLILDIARAHQSAALAKGIAVRTTLDQLPGTVGTDALRLHQIVDNLVGNAVRFTKSGQVDIAASITGDTTLHIVVSDTGPGIAEAERERVFERFERATTSEQEHGAGLGLAITKRVVDLLGGSIELHSEVGKGSRFTVALPTQHLAPVPAPALPEEPATDTAGLRVLYVEDVATNRMLVMQWAQQWRWKLFMVENGEAAIGLCEKEHFDILLIDLGLGSGMSGSELALRLRGTKRHRYTPMIAVTAFAEDGDDAEALKVGMNDRVTKPIDKAVLLGAVAFWSDRNVDAAPGPDLTELNAQYDGDKEKLLKVYQQYRKEFTQRRLALRDALIRGDTEALSIVRHQLRPHWQLLRLDDGLLLLDRLIVNGATPSHSGRMGGVEDLFRICDRALMGAQRALFTTT